MAIAGSAASVEPRALNLLTGPFTPASVRAATRRRTFLTAGACLVVALLLGIGMESRRRRRHFDFGGGVELFTSSNSPTFSASRGTPFGWLGSRPAAKPAAVIVTVFASRSIT